jgi:hypothetical protein
VGLGKSLCDVAAATAASARFPERMRIVPVRGLNVATPVGFASVVGQKLQRGFGRPHAGCRVSRRASDQPTGAAADLTSFVDGEM